MHSVDKLWVHCLYFKLIIKLWCFFLCLQSISEWYSRLEVHLFAAGNYLAAKYDSARSKQAYVAYLSQHSAHFDGLPLWSQPWLVFTFGHCFCFSSTFFWLLWFVWCIAVFASVIILILPFVRDARLANANSLDSEHHLPCCIAPNTICLHSMFHICGILHHSSTINLLLVENRRIQLFHLVFKSEPIFIWQNISCMSGQ